MSLRSISIQLLVFLGGESFKTLKVQGQESLRSTSQARAVIPLFFCTRMRATNPHQPLGIHSVCLNKQARF